MKLIVQIPCLNEEHTLAGTVADIPRHIPGVDEVEILVVDDGSSDRTAEVARRLGVEHVVRHTHRCGLARAFRTGIDTCLRLGADVIVNTDGDNQYAGWDIPRLVEPILRGEADIVVGDRQTWSVPHFSRAKRLLQAVGSCVVRAASGTEVPDAVSGFRAFSRDAALQMNVLSSFSYTIETLIQAGAKGLSIASVTVATNGKTRESRLFTNIPQFLRRSVATLVRTYAMYSPLRVFCFVGGILFLGGLLPVARFLWLFFVAGSGGGHIQSLVLGGALLVLGFMSLLIGVVADLIARNRQLLELVLENVRRIAVEECDRERRIAHRLRVASDCEKQHEDELEPALCLDSDVVRNGRLSRPDRRHEDNT